VHVRVDEHHVVQGRVVRHRRNVLGTNKSERRRRGNEPLPEARVLTLPVRSARPRRSPT
jgi:hypothetical protein